ncbi:hypothetical protein EDC04DRAFT_2604206 [Pisolithus marmoratus]|nr:hypothetical protein EDC04DRAFT_2604206 [Pisolithus marmoratus]
MCCNSTAFQMKVVATATGSSWLLYAFSPWVSDPTTFHLCMMSLQSSGTVVHILISQGSQYLMKEPWPSMSYQLQFKWNTQTPYQLSPRSCTDACSADPINTFKAVLIMCKNFPLVHSPQHQASTNIPAFTGTLCLLTMVTSEASGENPTSPNPVIPANSGDLYLHQHHLNIQIWLKEASGWVIGCGKMTDCNPFMGNAVTGLYMMPPVYKIHARNDKQLAPSGAPPSATVKSRARDSTREQQEEQILAETLFHPGPMDALVSTPYNDAPHVHKPPGVQRDPTLQSDCSNKLTDPHPQLTFTSRQQSSNMQFLTHQDQIVMLASKADIIQPMVIKS